MKRSTFWLIVLLFIDSCGKEEVSTNLVYQPFPTKNAFWTITHCEFSFFPKTAFVKVGVFGDTFIHGKSYHKLYAQTKWKYGTSCDNCNFNFDKSTSSYFISIREEAKRIYIVPQQSIGTDPAGAEYLIYDFNIQRVGDKVSVYPFFFQPVGSMSNEMPAAGWGSISNDVPVEYTVKEIRQVKFSDGSVRNAYLFDDVILEAWIEGVGTTSGFSPFNHIYDISDNTIGFSSNGIHLIDIRNLNLAYMGDCGIQPFTYELTTK